MKGKERFEDFLGQVEKSIQALEGGSLGLEESLAQYEEGIKALRQCYQILEGAEKRIQILLKDQTGQAAPQPFDVKASEEAEREARAQAAPAKRAPQAPKSKEDRDELPF